MKTINMIFFSLLLFNSLNCQKEESNSIFFEKYNKIFGKWKPVSVIGGKIPFEILPDFQLLSFEKKNAFFVKENEVICAGDVSIFKQTNDTLIIELIAKKGSSNLALSCKKLVSFSGDTLILDESIDCTDSYKYKFIRIN